MVIFNSYVKLPEGRCWRKPALLWLVLKPEDLCWRLPHLKTSHFDGAATHLCSQGVTRRLEASGRDALAIKKREINGNFRILKWRYCTIFQAIFWGYIPLHRPFLNRPKIYGIGTSVLNRFLSHGHWGDGGTCPIYNVWLRTRIPTDDDNPQYILVGGAITPLKNDGVRQWEGWHPIYEMENKIQVPNHQPVYICKG